MCHGLKWTCSDCWTKPVFEVGKKYERIGSHRYWTCLSIIKDYAILVDEEEPYATSSVPTSYRDKYKESIPPLKASMEMYLIQTPSGHVFIALSGYTIGSRYKTIGKKTLTITEGEGL